MWANRDWVGSALPAGVAAGHELGAYGQLLSSVEGNTTFYALPDARTAARWCEAVPDDFRFCFKLPKTITHDRRLRHVDVELREFIERLSPLRTAMGPTSVQLPASFGPSDLGALDAFLGLLPKDMEWAVEVRHTAFFADGEHERPLDDLLWQHNVNRVIFDTRAFFDGPATTEAELDALTNKPRLPVRPTRTASSPIVRFLGQTNSGANPVYWDRWIPKLAEWCDDEATPYFFFHTPDNRTAPQQAIAVHNAVAAHSTRVAKIEMPDFDRTLFSDL